MELRWNRYGIEMLAVSCIKLGVEMSKDGGCALLVSSLGPIRGNGRAWPSGGLTGSGAFQGEIC